MPVELYCAGQTVKCTEFKMEALQFGLRQLQISLASGGYAWTRHCKNRLGDATACSGPRAHRVHQRKYRVSVMFTLFQGRQGHSGLVSSHAATVCSTLKTWSLGFRWLQLPKLPAREAISL